MMGQEVNGTTSGGSPEKVRSQEEEEELLLQKARLIWFQAQSDHDLKQAEEIYESTFFSKRTTTCNDSGSKRQRLQNESHFHGTTDNDTGVDDVTIDCCPTMRNNAKSIAGERLAMLLLQSGRTQQADAILRELNYTCRLGTNVLNYPTSSSSSCKLSQPSKTTTAPPPARLLQEDPPCRIYDHFLNDTELEILQSVFSDPHSSYWTDHEYAVEPHPSPYVSYWTDHEYAVEPHPSPYVSYVIPLVGQDDDDDSSSSSSFGFLRVLIDRILEQLQEWKPSLKQQCTHVEMWAHNRPHATGHQLHFDSDNEGQGAVVRHPLISSILYLSSSNSGGPSMITHQRRVSRQLATRAWLAFPALQRLTAFDGRVLHGVIPGKGFVVAPDKNNNLSGTNRVTLMLAFWRRLQVRDHGTSKVGAARRFPNVDATPWAKLLRQPFQPTPTIKQQQQPPKSAAVTKVDPIELDHVYETVGSSSSNSSSAPWSPRMGMPLYDEIYQGF